MASKPRNLLKPLISRSVVSRKGTILIITLWSLFLLATFAVSLGNGVRQKIVLVGRLDERGKLHLIAEAGIKKAIVELRKESKGAYHSSEDSRWNDNPGAFKGIQLGDGTLDIFYDYIDDETGILEIRYGLIDEERKININKAGQTVLECLLRIVLDFDEIEAQELAASIIDWRDNDSELSIPLGSAEDRYYANLQYPYEAKDAEFEVLEELLLVKGMNRDIFEKIKGYITIYGNGKINVNTASKNVLLSLGLNEDIVEGIISFRNDKFFDNTSSIVPQFSQFSHLSASEIAQLSTITNQYLITKPGNFMIRSVAKLNNRRNASEVVSVVDHSGNILYWQEP